MTKAQLEAKVRELILQEQPLSVRWSAMCNLLADYFQDTSCAPPVAINEADFQFKNPFDNTVPNVYLHIDGYGISIHTFGTSNGRRLIGERTWEHMGIESPMPLITRNGMVQE